MTLETELKLARVESEQGPIALVTIDNGEDYTKPTSLGRSALESLARLLDDLEAGDWKGMLLTGKPFVFCAGADINEFHGIDPETARLGSKTGHDLRPHRGASLPHARRDQRSRARRRRRDRVPLRLPHDLDRRPALRGAGGLPRALSSLGRYAARPEARRYRDRDPLQRDEPSPPEQDAHRRGGARARLRRRAVRADRVPRRVARFPPPRPEGPRPSDSHLDASEVAEAVEKARRQLDDSLRRGAGALQDARADGLRRLEHRGGLRRRRGCDRRAASEPTGAGLPVRVRPGRAPGEAQPGPAGRRSARSRRSGSSARA